MTLQLVTPPPSTTYLEHLLPERLLPLEDSLLCDDVRNNALIQAALEETVGEVCDRIEGVMVHNSNVFFIRKHAVVDNFGFQIWIVGEEGRDQASLADSGPSCESKKKAATKHTNERSL